MTHRKRKTSQKQSPSEPQKAVQPALPELALVLKADAMGTVEAVRDGMPGVDGVDIQIIAAGVGSVSQSDIFLAATASRLVLGFNVMVAPKLEPLLRENGVEVRLYQVIYKLFADVREIGGGLVRNLKKNPEEVRGSGRIIARFKSCRHGIILGCEVTDGILNQGDSFRIISAMGPIYTGRIESMQIERKPVTRARVGQRVGIKIRNFDRAREGDLVEVFQESKSKAKAMWRPRPGIFQR